MWLFRPTRLDTSRSARQFIFRSLAQQFVVKALAAIIIVVALPDARTADRTAQFKDPVAAFVMIVLIAPPLETLLLQAAPIEICRRLRMTKLVQFIAGSLLFALLHFLGGVASGIAAGVVGGLFFSHAYLECRARSWWTAAWVTTTMHGLHNLVVFPIALLLAD